MQVQIMGDHDGRISAGITGLMFLDNELTDWFRPVMEFLALHGAASCPMAERNLLTFQ